MAQLYFENAMGRIFEHPNGYAWLCYHSGQRTLSDVQGFLTHTGRLLQRYGWHRMLSDQRVMLPFTEDERLLILDYWQKRYLAYGLVTGAVVLSHDVFTRLSFSQIQQQAQGVLSYRMFELEEAAISWLTQLA
ncbi:hypothetical protein [uncultured Hymenobacter sp.]|uniref:hypothetical protein n=1 Tax=uncultured Hymenobacter sp. TaxID=170016 RepID=UPI0035C95837